MRFFPSYALNLKFYHHFWHCKAAILRRSKETAIEVKEISQEDMLKDRLKYQTLDVTTGAASVPSMRNNYVGVYIPSTVCIL